MTSAQVIIELGSASGQPLTFVTRRSRWLGNCDRVEERRCTGRSMGAVSSAVIQAQSGSTVGHVDTTGAGRWMGRHPSCVR